MNIEIGEQVQLWSIETTLLQTSVLCDLEFEVYDYMYSLIETISDYLDEY